MSAITPLQYPVGYKDSLHRIVIEGLKSWTRWLQRNNVRGYIGEVIWPNMQQRTFNYDAHLWNDLANEYLKVCNQNNLWVTFHGLDEAQIFGGFAYSFYRSPSDGSTRNFSIVETQGPTLEGHPTTADYERGVTLTRGDEGADAINNFSNQNVGIYDTTYWYFNQTNLNYIAGRGHKIVRLHIRWERIQRTLNGTLDATEQTRINDFITRAATAGLGVILDVHNYGGYFLYNSGSGTPGTGTEYKLGSAQVTQAHLVDLWTRLSTWIKADTTRNSTVIAYDIMNEPNGIVAASGLTQAKTWEQMSQAVVTAIRNPAGNNDTKLLMISGNQWDVIDDFPLQHPTAWITDSANNHMYTVHDYWAYSSSSRVVYWEHDYVYERNGAFARGYPA